MSSPLKKEAATFAPPEGGDVNVLSYLVRMLTGHGVHVKRCGSQVGVEAQPLRTANRLGSARPRE